MTMTTIKITQIRVQIMEKLESMLETGNSRYAIVDMARMVGSDDVDEASAVNFSVPDGGAHQGRSSEAEERTR
jgi:hypothetical protein